MQASDDPKLLELMLQDIVRAPNIYKPTNYWSVLKKDSLRELQKYGLHDFSRRKNSIFSALVGTTALTPSFGTNLLQSKIIANRITLKIPLLRDMLKRLLYCYPQLSNKTLPLVKKLFPISTPYGITVEDIKQLSYETARCEGEKVGAKPLSDFQVSQVGNPEDIILIGNKRYTINILNDYLRYVYCCKFLDFNNTITIVELGGGYGRQVEVIKKLHPNTNFLLFDIPPQSYLCEQYLSAVFPGCVISYRETRDMDSIPNMGNGKIYIFGNWKFPILKAAKIDLFWNASSFQEMEPDIVANYLRYINANENIKSVFLKEGMQGQGLARKEGTYGVVKQTTLDDYKEGLSNFELLDMSDSPTLPRIVSSYGQSHDSFWRRANSQRPLSP